MNSNIIDISNFTPERDRYDFRVVQVPIIGEDEDRRVPCIMVCEAETGIGIFCPGYERWYLDLSRSGFKASETLKQKAYAIDEFLNFMLHNTKLSRLEDLDINDMRDFITFYKKKNDGEDRNATEWSRGIGHVYNFCMMYQSYHKNKTFKFNFYEMCKLENPNYNQTYKRGSSIKIDNHLYIYNMLGVKPPAVKNKKNRVLLEPYMDIFLMCAVLNDPMIALAMMLQANAGLREGEVVNLTRNSIKIVYGGFGSINKIEIDLTHEASFAKNTDQKMEFGHIKKFRTARVYTDFIEKVYKMYNHHDDMLFNMGITEKTDDTPLFINRSGKPMTVHCYKGRVKKLFYEHFLPLLEEMSREENKWAQNAPFIEKYRKGYPGAHMFRHWFTMYLVNHITVTKNQDVIDIVADWRGDSDRTSMEDYLSVNADLISMYKNCAFTMQNNLMEIIK